MLLKRARVAVPKAVERLCAMQAQDPKAPYIGLWTRLEGFRKEQLTRAYERKRVVRGTLFRVTVQLVGAADHPGFSAVMQQRWKDEFANWGIPQDELAGRIRSLADDGPFAMAKANAITPELPERLRWRVRCLTPLVHVPPSGTWGIVGIRATTSERWLGAPQPEPDVGAALLVRRYLAAYGPASREDLLRFAGLRVKDVRAGLEALDLLRFEAEDGRTLYDLKRAPRPPADTPAPVRFLPMWDHLLLGYDERERTLPAEYRPAVIQKNGDVRQTFLVDGVVAGLWSYKDGKVKTEPFAPLPRTVRRELEEEAARLAAFHE